MSCKKGIVRNCIALSVVLAVGSIFCFQTPSTARVINSDVLSIQLGQTEEKAMLNSNLLVEGGQTILLNKDTNELVVPIIITCENFEELENAVGTMKAVSSDESKLQVSLDKEEILLQELENTVNLTIKVAEPVEEPEDEKETLPDTETGETPDTEETPDAEETPDEGTNEVPDGGTEETPDPGTDEVPDGGTEETPDPGTDEVPDSGTEETPDTEEEVPDEGSEETPEAGTEKTPNLAIQFLSWIVTGTAQESEVTTSTESTTEPVTEITTDTEQSQQEEVVTQTEEVTEPEEVIQVEEATEQETTATEETSTTETEEITENEIEETPDTEVEEEAIPEETVFAEVTFTLGEQVYSAKFLIEDDAEPTEAIGELAFCQSQYHPTQKMTIINGQEADCILNGFPAMTRYTIENNTYMLYSAGSIQLSAGKTTEIDLSLTAQKEDLVLTAGSGKTYTMKYEELPEIAVEEYPLIVTIDGLLLPISYKWGNAEPMIEVEHLIEGEETPVWEPVENVTIDVEDEKIEVVPNGSAAGTYRANVSWRENEVTLYQMEIPFFIQYESADQGGTGQ